MNENRDPDRESDSRLQDPWLGVLTGQAPAIDASGRTAEALRAILLEPDPETPAEELRFEHQRQIRVLLQSGYRGQGFHLVTTDMTSSDAKKGSAPEFAQHPSSVRPGWRGRDATIPSRARLSGPWAGSYVALASAAALSILVVWNSRTGEPSPVARLQRHPVQVVVAADPGARAETLREQMRLLGIDVKALNGARQVTLSARIDAKHATSVKQYLASQGIEWKIGDGLELVIQSSSDDAAGSVAPSQPRR